MKKTSNHDVCSLFKSSISRTHKVLAASVVLTTALLCGCSDSDPAEEGGLTPEPQVAKKEGVVTVGSNPNDPELMKRITFFGNNGSRAASNVVFPNFSEIEGPANDNLDNLLNVDSKEKWNQNESNIKEGNPYVISGGELGQFYLYEGNVYITGNVKIQQFEKGSTNIGTVYVMKGATLTVTSNQISNVTIKVFGTFKHENDETFITQDAKLLVSGNLTVNKLNIQNGGECVVDGNLTVSGYAQVQSSGQLLVKQNLEAKDELVVGGTIVVNGELTVYKKLTYNGNSGKVKGKCIQILSTDEKDAINTGGGGILVVCSYLNTKSLYMDGSSQLYLWPNAMADVSYKTWFAANSGGIFYDPVNDNTSGNALLRTKILDANGNSVERVQGMFTGNLKVLYEEKGENLKNVDISKPENYIIPEKNCNPGTTIDPGTQTPPSIDEVAIIEGPGDVTTNGHTHTHLSATCVQAVGNKAYVSYHLNTEYEDNAQWGEISQHMGCAEMYEITGSNAQITSWLMNKEFDFNHLLVDKDYNKAYFVGDTKAYGATLGVIDLESNGSFGQNEAKMPYYNLYKATAEESRGTSGNCMVLDGNHYRIASYKGFQSFSADALRKGTLEQTYELIQTNGSAKHIATDGNYIVTLNLNEKGVKASPATITVYQKGSWGINPVCEITVDGDHIITPIDGKNVVAVKDGFVYVALGQNGVAKYDIKGGDKPVAEYCWNKKDSTSDADEKKPLANGLCVDENYVYVANGAVGMIVLDKDLNYLTRFCRTYTEGNKEKSYSANYVQKVGNLVYIAYGRNGLEVVKLRTPSFEN